jgi:hypothetical protein
MKIDENLIDEVKEIENLTNYDLTEISENENDTPTAESFFKEPEITPEKKKRGRPAKTPAPPPIKKPFGLDETTEQTFLEQDENEEFIKTDTGSTIDDTKISLNNLLPGDTLIIVLDKLMSVVLPLALNNLAGTKLKPADLKLTAEEKKQLKPAVEACAKTIPVNFSNPWTALGITALAVYGAKTMDKINFDNMDADDFAPKTERRGRPRKS